MHNWNEKHIKAVGLSPAGVRYRSLSEILITSGASIAETVSRTKKSIPSGHTVGLYSNR